MAPVNEVVARTDQERLIVLETKVDAIIESQKSITTKLDVLIPTLVTQTQLAEKTTVLNAEIAALKLELISSKKRSTLLNWLTGILGTVFGIVMTILIQGYFSN